MCRRLLTETDFSGSNRTDSRSENNNAGERNRIYRPDAIRRMFTVASSRVSDGDRNRFVRKRSTGETTLQGDAVRTKRNGTRDRVSDDVRTGRQTTGYCGQRRFVRVVGPATRMAPAPSAGSECRDLPS